MAKFALSLALLALLALGSEAASFNSLCKEAGKPTKFKGKLTNGGKRVGSAKYCFADKLSGTGYFQIRVSGVQDLRSVDYYTGEPAPAASNVAVAISNNSTTLVETGNAYYTSNINAIIQITGPISGPVSNINIAACASRLYAGIATGPVGSQGIRQPASLLKLTSGSSNC
ncbi:hypothetical protein Rsub_10086 [Raphidocelis subcapitata]|uniref:CHRD domain-containing protein n=1 Tax=Raphidocelis subcapitata TaxID=307507 RepID=A0A2V0PJK3_9CHLO|nr:hypothetical protein Rsub_10086 [Raphidocelis subcapitata]|eukprot:GBF97225.1 hypothetical protein Rsub_10086 [Raphidocelis subcapitata]